VNDELLRQHSKMCAGLPSSVTKSPASWKASIEIIDLSHCKLKRLQGLEALVCLREAHFGHNDIEVIEGLAACVQLEELDLEKNLLTAIENLEANLLLKAIDLGKNKISSLKGLEQLQNLQLLSLSDNAIGSVEGFPALRSLSELYLANNLLSESKELGAFKPLEKLIILDLSGNPLCKDPNYRQYTLFVNRKLKILDGVSIEAQEQQYAKHLFTGRITEEILLERIGELQVKHVKELDLSGCKLRDVEESFDASIFESLEELNLQNNLFTSCKFLGHLPRLDILILCDNKIETLFTSNDASIKRGLNGCQVHALTAPA